MKFLIIILLVSYSFNFKALAMLEDFTDSQLELLQLNQQTYILFTLSPHMPLSYLAYQELKLAAKKQSIEIVVLLDPKVSWSEHTRFADTMQFKFDKIWHLKSNQLFIRGLHLHYPAVMLINQGQLSPRIYPGHKPQSVYSEWILVEKKLWQ